MLARDWRIRIEDILGAIAKIQRYTETFQKMRPLLSLIQLEFRSPGDDLMSMLHVQRDHLFQVQHDGFLIHHRQHNYAESRLHLGMLVELIQYNLRISIFTKLYENA